MSYLFFFSYSCSSEAGMQPYLNDIVIPLVQILKHLTQTGIFMQDMNHGTLAENVAITLGRLGIVCGPALAPSLGGFIKQWCVVLRTVRDLRERWSAYRGLCELVRLNPNAVFEANVRIYYAWQFDSSDCVSCYAIFFY
jgi:transportin-1